MSEKHFLCEVKMWLFKICKKISIYFFIILVYLRLSMMFTNKSYMIFSVSSYIIFAVLPILYFIKLARKKSKIQKGIRMEVISAIVISILVLCTKAYIDKRNLLVLKGSKQNISIAELMNNWKQSAAEMKEYDKLFKIDKYENSTIYYTDEIEPALKLVHAYLDKAKMDNEKLFGDKIKRPITIKFDYKEEVFKKRNSTFKDYAGLYFYDKKEAYLFIEDCYNNTLALNLKSSYLRKVLLHEYTHHAFYEFLDFNEIPKNKIPIWFMEGICDYIGYEDNNGYTPEMMLDFEELNTHIQWEDYNNQALLIYLQSLS